MIFPSCRITIPSSRSDLNLLRKSSIKITGIIHNVCFYVVSIARIRTGHLLQVDSTESN